MGRMSSTPTFRPDILGPGFEQATLELGPDPDTGKDVRAVVVRSTSPNTDPEKPTLLWIHGMSDYFFQTHVAEYFTELGYPFYAVDLRRCGRARTPGQRWHYTLDVEHYYPELNAALDVIAAENPSATVIPFAHSTGGLIAPLWVDHLRTHDPERHRRIAGMILNSPWLDLQYHPVQVALMRPVINLVGRVAPRLPLPQDGLGTYGESIHESKYGEWSFDTDKKPVYGHRKYFGWIRAINKAQRRIHAGDVDAGVPTLTLVSAHSYLGQDYSPAADTADTVLDVEQIRKWAPHLSRNHTTKTIDGARHDVFLSEPFAREVAFKATAEWLETL